MNILRSKLLIFIVIIILGLVFIFLWVKDKNSQPQPPKEVTQEQSDNLRVVSTKPDPLDNSTILPTDSLEITFNKPISVSEFKHHFDPEVEHEIEAIGQSTPKGSYQFKISFKKPLELGAGYTLFVESRTKTNSGETLDHEYNYHIKTIGYRGV